MNRVHLRQTVAFLHQVRKAHRLQAGLEGEMMALMPGPRVLQSLLLQHQ